MRRQPLDGGDLLALAARRQRQAGHHAPAIQMNGAGAAGATVAALLGARQPGIFTQRIQQRRAMIDHKFHRLAIDMQRDRNDIG